MRVEECELEGLEDGLKKIPFCVKEYSVKVRVVDSFRCLKGIIRNSQKSSEFIFSEHKYYLLFLGAFW